MNIHDFRTIEGVIEIQQDFKIVHLVVEIGLDLNRKERYEKRETGSRDKVSFEGDVLILIFL